jgi:hypothetical protein
LGSVKTSNLSLSLLVLFSILSSFVEDLLISDLSHFFWVAILYIESVVAFEKDIFGELLCLFALVLLLKIDEGLLGSRDNLDLVWTFTSISRSKIKAYLILCCSEREVLDKQTKVHD